MCMTLVNFLDENNVIFMKQFGFRRNHSTINAVQLLVSDILSSFEEHLSVACNFIDLRKAFDTVSHSIIIKKLECLGIRGVLLNWFKSYLTMRQQFTYVNNAISDIRYMECGIPQGSLLRVLMFQLQINDMPHCLRFSNSILYADDTTIYVVGRNVKFI